MEISKPLLDRSEIVEEAKLTTKNLENLKEEFKQVLDQLSTISESGDDENSLIQQKVDFLKKNLETIDRGLEDAQIFFAEINIVENIENEVRSLKERIKSLKEEKNSLRCDLSMTHKKWIESEIQRVTLEI